MGAIINNKSTTKQPTTLERTAVEATGMGMSYMSRYM